MIERVVASEPAHIQDVITLVLECSRVGRTHGLLVRRAAVLANTTGIKCRERFADGVVITRDVDAWVEILGKEERKEMKLLSRIFSCGGLFSLRVHQRKFDNFIKQSTTKQQEFPCFVSFSRKCVIARYNYSM